ncbi:MAG: 2-dehydropantoate 2-reductase [Lachnospiraceae bacterium]|nr:2-dehydropantoate 2-reductase [Lachnospiraceae bacterium]MBR2532646.1 2-dehydropantoate 2-reductase [Lachnospiraceae bacterium]
MKVTMMGAGAMGGMVGARLAAAGNDVWLVDTWREHVAKMQKDGLTLDTREGTQVLKVRATTNVHDVYDQDGYMELVIIFVNTNFTDRITRDAKVIIGPDTYVLTVQNGVGNADIIAKYVPKNRIILGTTLAAGVVEGPAHVRDSGTSGFTQIMPMEGPVTPAIEKICETLSEAGLETQATPEAEKAIWKKLCINVCTCGIGMITRLSCGQVCEPPHGRALSSELIREVCEVANAKGLDLDYETERDHFFEIYTPSTHYSSMNQNAKKHMKTEVETITGAVVREGQRLGIPVPYNTTIYHLINMIQDHYEDQMY